MRAPRAIHQHRVGRLFSSQGSRPHPMAPIPEKHRAKTTRKPMKPRIMPMRSAIPNRRSGRVLLARKTRTLLTKVTAMIIGAQIQGLKNPNMNPETTPCQKVNVGPRFSFCSMLPNPSANIVLSDKHSGGISTRKTRYTTIHPFISNRLRRSFDAYEVCYASALCVKTGFALCFYWSPIPDQYPAPASSESETHSMSRCNDKIGA
jgi:hypothetical protein